MIILNNYDTKSLSRSDKSTDRDDRRNNGCERGREIERDLNYIIVRHSSLIVTFLMPVVFLPISAIFSWIFSHTRGTEKKSVGLTSLIVTVRDPFRASGWQKYTEQPGSRINNSRRRSRMEKHDVRKQGIM